MNGKADSEVSKATTEIQRVQGPWKTGTGRDGTDMQLSPVFLGERQSDPRNPRKVTLEEEPVLFHVQIL